MALAVSTERQELGLEFQMKELIRLLRLAVLAIPMAVTASVPLLQGCGGGNCCKVCDFGMACGDTCLAKNEVCHVGVGCACD
jgi:hypothetical protein